MGTPFGRNFKGHALRKEPPKQTHLRLMALKRKYGKFTGAHEIFKNVGPNTEESTVVHRISRAIIVLYAEGCITQERAREQHQKLTDTYFGSPDTAGSE